MADEKKTAIKVIPETLKATEIPNNDKWFLYLALQESKGNGMTKDDWEKLAGWSNNSLKSKTFRESFGSIRAAAKKFAESNGENSPNDQSGPPTSKAVAKRSPKKRDAQQINGDTEPSTPTKKARKNPKSDTRVKEEDEGEASMDTTADAANHTEIKAVKASKKAAKKSKSPSKAVCPPNDAGPNEFAETDQAGTAAAGAKKQVPKDQGKETGKEGGIGLSNEAV